MSTTANGRTADYSIDTIFLERWSPRAFTGETIAREELFSMLEAARWAPSSSNAQPWRFLYALHGTPAFEHFVSLLVPGNQVWAKNASALLFFVSKKTSTSPSGKVVPLGTHSFDTGTASGFFALEVRKRGWYAHGMAGIERDRAVQELNITDDYHLECAYAVGRHGDPATLPPELAEREKPNTRRPLAESVFEGKLQP
ncbi:MAG: nitroreductase family protein [Edaphobacter sp.]|uniref:nitroreductase family protein n=1 Tax=Edaphobacter sp. TaxID=1934404 RepID=UPI00239F7553|nr:nitroreductase family protein [Edaphobacter sp.]MDE1176674.1 nitroreductase family protein [Edaphobacter sp.]